MCDEKAQMGHSEGQVFQFGNSPSQGPSEDPSLKATQISWVQVNESPASPFFPGGQEHPPCLQSDCRRLSSSASSFWAGSPRHGSSLDVSTWCLPEHVLLPVWEAGDTLFPAARQAGTEQRAAFDLKGAQINAAK